MALLLAWARFETPLPFCGIAVALAEDGASIT